MIRTFSAAPEHIDELGHVNNAVWVQWIQDIATAHWDAAARPEDRAAFFWVVTRHEIDYRGNIDAGQSVTGETWIEGPARGGGHGASACRERRERRAPWARSSHEVKSVPIAPSLRAL